ncbi:MAG: hypothetical protein PVH52_05230, partial [bacterium]
MNLPALELLEIQPGLFGPGRVRIDLQVALPFVNGLLALAHYLLSERQGILGFPVFGIDLDGFLE